MLSRNERRQLDAIERRLQREDPGLAHRLSADPIARWDQPKLSAAALVIGIIGLLSGLLAANAMIGILVGVLPLCAWWWLRRRRGRAHNDS